MINAIEKYNQHKLNIGLVNAFVSTLPSSNLKDGDIYILNSNNSVNIYYNSSWRSITATTGMLCVLKTDSNIYVFSNGSWERKSTDISQTYLDTELAKKVDKIDGYSLVSDNDILNWNSKADGEHTHIMEDITNFPTIPTVTNDLTNELKNNYDNAYANTHTHSNKSKIDKIGEDVNGNLTYNGNTIVANSTWDNISDKPFETLDNNTLKVTDGILSVIGGGGTTNYSDLENKPSINSVELTGNKTLADLGIQPSGDYLTEIPSEYVTDTELESKGYANTSQIPDVSNKLEVSNILQGTNIILNKVGNDITINSEGGSGGSVVTDSEINGNIVIDGSETNVYTLPSDVAKTSDLHSHNNKTALDEITTVKTTEWDTVTNKLDKTSDTKDNIATFTEAEIDENIATNETHSTIFGKLLKSIKTLRHNIGVLTSDKIDKANIVNNGITTVEGTVLDGRMGKTLTDNATALAESASQISLQLSQKITKNTASVTDADLSQEVKEQMTGGSVAVVGKNAVIGYENIVPNTVTSSEVNFITSSQTVNYIEGDYAIIGGLITRTTVGNPTSFAVMEIELSTRYVLRIEGNAGNRWAVATTVEAVNLDELMPYSNDPSSYVRPDVLLFNSSGNSLSESNYEFLNRDNRFLYIYADTSNVKPKITLEKTETEFEYPVNLKSLPLYPDEKITGISSLKISTNLFTGYSDTDVVISEAKVNGTLKTIITRIATSGVPNTAIIDLEPDTSYVIGINGEPGNRWRAVVINEIIDYSSLPPFERDEDLEVINPVVPDKTLFYNKPNEPYTEATFHNDSEGKQLIVYTDNTNAKPLLYVEKNEIDFKYPISLKSLPDSYSPNINRNVFLESVSLYNSPDLPSVASGEPFFLGGSQSSQIYQMFDDLMAAHPEYISKSLIGNEAVSNLPIYMYSFKPEIVSIGRDNPVPSGIKLPKGLIIGCIHGEEKQGTWSILKFFEDICNNWKNNETLEFFRHNVEFKVVPIVNPWGYNANVRENGNGKDLNREFKKPVEDIQVEAQLIKGFIDDNLDASFYLDLHTMWQGIDRNISWLIPAEHSLYPMGQSIISKLSRKWKKQYPFITYDGLLGYIGNPDYLSAGDNGQSRNYALRAGVKNAMTLELANHVSYSVEPLRYGELTTNMYVDFLGNTLVAFAIKLGANYK